jgi:bisanhydrobacterioruberin hydratase
MLKILKTIAPLSISTFIALLFHINGAIGMAGSEKNWFVAMTPVNLLVMFFLLIYTEGGKNKNFVLFFLLCFVVGMFVEIIGVNTGLLFGHYLYGEPMGTKLLGVPLLIGVQWFVSIYCSTHIILGFEKLVKNGVFNPFIPAIFTATVTTVFDYIIEPAAIKLNFWHWYGHDVPLYNYVCWFVISFLLSFFYFKKRKDVVPINYFAIVLFFIQIVFFIYVTKYL